MVRPAARLAKRIHVGAAEKVGLHIHLLDVEFARLDLLIHILVTWVEAARVAAHGDEFARLGQRHHVLCTLERIGQWNFHLDMFASLQARDGLLGVHLRGRAQNDRIHLLECKAFAQIGRHMRNAVFGGNLPGFFKVTANDGNDFHAVDVPDAVDVFDTEGARARQGYFDGFAHGVNFQEFSRIRCPTEVLLAGTW